MDPQIRLLCVSIVVSQTLSAATYIDTTRTGSWYRGVAASHTLGGLIRFIQLQSINISSRSGSLLVMIDTIRGGGCRRIRIHIVECFVGVFERGII